MAARLKEKYHKEIKGALQKELGLENPMAVPRLEKIVVNMGLGEATQNSKMLDPLANDLAAIAGQKPVTTRAKKSIAAFKVRENMPIGAMVTLRGDTISRSAGLGGAASGARFSGCFDEELRWTGQLHAGHTGSADLSGDRLLEGGEAEGNEHHDCDDGGGR